LMKKNLFNFLIRMIDINVKRNKKTSQVNNTNISGVSIQNKTLFIWDCTKGNEKKNSKNSMEKYLALSFTFPVNQNGISYTDIFFQRPVDESFVLTRKRLNTKLLKYIGKIEGKNKVEKLMIDVCFNPENQVIMDESLVTNQEVFFDDTIKNFIIGDNKYQILRQRPNILKFDIDMVPIVGCPVISAYEFDNNDINNPNIHWYVAPPNTAVPKLFDFKNNDLENILPEWKYVATTNIFYPKKEHTGMVLAAILDIGENTIKKVKSTGQNVIQCYEEDYLHYDMIKQLKNNKKVDKSYRIMSFNILADLYLNLKQPQEKLYFAYCPKEYQESGFRYPLTLKVLNDFDADILCLQEVDNKMQKRFLLPFLEQMNYSNYFAIKGNFVNEGVLISWKKSKFKLLRSENILIKDMLDLEEYPENMDVCKYLEKDEEIDDKFRTRPTVLLSCLLEDLQSGVQILVSTTHLHFDPKHENIKCLQALLCWRFIEKLKNEIGEDTKILFCGDFNVTPEGGAVQLSINGYTKENEECWECTPTMGGSIFKIQDTYQSLCKFPCYTNYTYWFNEKENEYTGFEGTLDYIWGDKSIKVTKIIDMPKHENVIKYGALPSKHFPSDHLPICCEYSLII
uniref:MARVEL domain-containing protein n=1 Tax=Strongyloides stercoralis TaxID=6248 RepID=A0AAF5DHU7_STRER